MGKILFAVLSAMVITVTNDENKNTKAVKSNTYNKAEKIHNLRRKYENMSSYEIDEELKYYDYYSQYVTYSREYKINKLVDIMTNRL